MSESEENSPIPAAAPDQPISSAPQSASMPQSPIAPPPGLPPPTVLAPPTKSSTPPGPPPPLGVRFKRAGKVYYFNSAGFPDLKVGDGVVVETTRGHELGWVAIAPGQIVAADVANLKSIVRRASDNDLASLERHRRDEASALAQTKSQIAEHKLPMKAVLTEYNFDGSQLTVYFVSEEHRVDFRELVRDLARALRTRVHLRQIGARDQAKLLGGIDRCGRELCCTTWIPEFQPITIRMAKNQNLPLNPTEISGVCGKLLCCLEFEDEQYRELNKGMPKVGASLTSAVGRGRVIDVNALTRKITIAWEDGSRVEVDADEFTEQQERRKRTLGETG